MYIPDPLDLWNEREYEIQKQLERLPVCDCCGEPIQQDTAIVFNDSWFCDCCLTEYFRKDVEDYAGTPCIFE